MSFLKEILFETPIHKMIKTEPLLGFKAPFLPYQAPWGTASQSQVSKFEELLLRSSYPLLVKLCLHLETSCPHYSILYGAHVFIFHGLSSFWGGKEERLVGSLTSLSKHDQKSLIKKKRKSVWLPTERVLNYNQDQ